jgi:GNAT superfamily N-acetyltransferase/predicted RNA-binding protein with PIN domain
MVEIPEPATARDLREVGRLYVDAMNVIGSRPDGWWRDRPGAVRRLLDRLGPLATGTAATIVVVVDGPPAEGAEGDGAIGPPPSVEVHHASRCGRDAADDRLVELLEAQPPASDEDRVVVVTADRELRERVAALGAEVLGPRRLLEVLDAFDQLPALGAEEVVRRCRARLATVERWREVRALRLAALADTPDAFAGTVEEEGQQPPAWWRERLASEDAATVLAEVQLTDGQAVGVALAVIAPAFERTDAAGLYGVWVAPWVRGLGVGDVLLEATIEEARRRGAGRLALDVGDRNLPAIRLYERFGFVPTGRTTTLPPPREHVTEHERLLDLTAPPPR